MHSNWLFHFGHKYLLKLPIETYNNPLFGENKFALRIFLQPLVVTIRLHYTSYKCKGTEERRCNSHAKVTAVTSARCPPRVPPLPAPRSPQPAPAQPPAECSSEHAQSQTRRRRQIAEAPFYTHHSINRESRLIPTIPNYTTLQSKPKRVYLINFSFNFN